LVYSKTAFHTPAAGSLTTDHVRLTSSSPSTTRYFGAFVTKRYISAYASYF